MPRDSSGIYTLPLAPVVAGTPIEATWANTTMNDLASSMTDSLSRSGSGGMQVALRLVDGVVGTPGINFNSEPSSGWYRAGTFDVRGSLAGVDLLRMYQDGSGDRFFQLWDGVAWNSIGGDATVANGSVINASTFDGFGVTTVNNAGVGIFDITFDVAASAPAKQVIHVTPGANTPLMTSVVKTSATVVRIYFENDTGAAVNVIPFDVTRWLIN